MTHDTLVQKLKDFTGDLTRILLDAGLYVEIDQETFAMDNPHLLKTGSKSTSLEILGAFYDMVQEQVRDANVRDTVSHIVDEYINFISAHTESELRLTH
jgi:hypothetical protein